MTDQILRGRRVLVVEDEILLTMALEDMLKELGAVVVASATTVAEALGQVMACRFDAAILDVDLNGQPSYPVAEALVGAGTPFAFTTGYADHDVHRRFKDCPILGKPFRPRELEAIGRSWFPTAEIADCPDATPASPTHKLRFVRTVGVI